MSLRRDLLRIASGLPAGDATRRRLLAALKSAWFVPGSPEANAIEFFSNTYEMMSSDSEAVRELKRLGYDGSVARELVKAFGRERPDLKHSNLADQEEAIEDLVVGVLDRYE